jgi:hypothetical protein
MVLRVRRPMPSNHSWAVSMQERGLIISYLQYMRKEIKILHFFIYFFEDESSQETRLDKFVQSHHCIEYMYIHTNELFELLTTVYDIWSTLPFGSINLYDPHALEASH